MEKTARSQHKMYSKSIAWLITSPPTKLIFLILMPVFLQKHVLQEHTLLNVFNLNVSALILSVAIHIKVMWKNVTMEMWLTEMGVVMHAWSKSTGSVQTSHLSSTQGSYCPNVLEFVETDIVWWGHLMLLMSSVMTEMM